jgi:hypothetical protein
VPALAWRARSKVEVPVPGATAAVALICRAMSPERGPADHRAPPGEYQIADSLAAQSYVEVPFESPGRFLIEISWAEAPM